VRKTSMAVPMQPPALTTPTVRAHRRTLELALEAMKADIGPLALASARGERGAPKLLAALHLKIRATEFEIECNQAACELADERDAAAHETWRKSVHNSPPAEVIEGITGGNCAARCLRGVPGGCVLGGGCISAGSECFHPHQRRDQFHLDKEGRRVFPFRYHERAAAIFDAACEKLNVQKEFSDE